jgi:hypothetical protein
MLDGFGRGWAPYAAVGARNHVGAHCNVPLHGCGHEVFPGFHNGTY